MDRERLRGLMEKAPEVDGWNAVFTMLGLTPGDGYPKLIAGLAHAAARIDELEADNLRLREAVVRRDAKAAECPIDRTRQHQNEPCPRCRADRGGTCFVKNDADYRLVSEVRDILARAALAKDPKA